MSEQMTSDEAVTGRGALAQRILRPHAGLGTAVWSAAVGLVMAYVLILTQGYEPIATIRYGLQYALGDLDSIARTLAWGLPLYVAGVGVAAAFRAGMFNIGAEGQVFAGAMGAALAGAYLGPFPTALHLFITVLVSAIVGALIAGALGWLRAAWSVDEVLSTLLANYIVILFCTYLANGPLHDPSRQSGTTRAVHDSARFGELVSTTGLTSAAFVVIALLVMAWWVSDHSIAGYRWRMTGESAGFSQSVGISIKRSQIHSMLFSGALCGIAGGLLVTASQGRFWTEIGANIGWNAVLVALIARARPVATIAWVTLYTIMRSTARGIETVTTVPAELSLVLVSAIIIVVAAKAGTFERFTALRRKFASWTGRA